MFSKKKNLDLWYKDMLKSNINLKGSKNAGFKKEIK